MNRLNLTNIPLESVSAFVSSGEVIYSNKIEIQSIRARVVSRCAPDSRPNWIQVIKSNFLDFSGISPRKRPPPRVRQLGRDNTRPHNTQTDPTELLVCSVSPRATLLRQITITPMSLLHPFLHGRPPFLRTVGFPCNPPILRVAAPYPS